MTFLKKLGQILLKGALVASGVLSLVSPMLGSKVSAIIGKVVDDFTLIGNQVVTVEVALNGKTGAEKFAALLPLVAGIIRTSELVGGKEIANEDLFQKGVQEVAQGVVDILNAVHEKEAQRA